jgi:hypothetical protein
MNDVELATLGQLLYTATGTTTEIAAAVAALES